ncbi:MAG TPA: hypothetical protein PLD23_01045 [Armatimonadota bacterium]|nr:hypothetical protein [Armatimonadota bacterium]
MAEPWFDPMRFGILFGAIGGGLGGTFIGVLGGLTGALAPQGKGRAVIVPIWVVTSALGALCLAVGIVAVVSGQPYGIWYPLVLAGGLVTVLCPTLLCLVVLPRYREAEQRRLAAREIRGAV